METNIRKTTNTIFAFRLKIDKLDFLFQDESAFALRKIS